MINIYKSTYQELILPSNLENTPNKVLQLKHFAPSPIPHLKHSHLGAHWDKWKQVDELRINVWEASKHTTTCVNSPQQEYGQGAIQILFDLLHFIPSIMSPLGKLHGGKVLWGSHVFLQVDGQPNMKYLKFSYEVEVGITISPLLRDHHHASTK